MRTKQNYQKKLEQQLKEVAGAGQAPRLLLHSCCAPCSSYVLEYLSAYFEITVFYYNPNIYPAEEFFLRAREQKRLTQELQTVHPISFLMREEDSRAFFHAVKGLESTGEGGARCYECFRLRLNKTASLAAKAGYDYFTTTLSISPLKNADWLNGLGEEAAKRYGTTYLYGDFKKKEGYKRSIELSKQFGLYRQDYCGCVFSREERQKRREFQEKAENNL